MSYQNPNAASPEMPSDDAPARVSVEELFDGNPEIRLLFRDTEYRLRITRNGKLILTK